MSEKIELSEVIDHVSSELLKAQEKANARGQATMQFSECEVEFAVETTKEAGGGIKVWLLDLKGGAKKTDKNTIRVKFDSIPEVAIQANQEISNSKGPKLKKQ